MGPHARGRRRVARRRADIAGVRMHYLVAGQRRRGGIPVVLVPPPGSSAGSLRPLLAQLGRTRLAFAIDLPGHGRSGSPPWGRRDPAAWLDGWLTRTGFEHAHLVCVDGSIGVALALLQTRPRVVTSLTLLTPPPLHRRSRLRTLRDRAGELPAQLRPRRLPRTAMGVVARTRSARASEFRQAMLPRDVQAELGSVGVPVIIFRGEHDPHLSRTEASTLARAAHGSLVELPGCARDCTRTHATAVAGTLARWWAAVDGPDDGTTLHVSRPHRTVGER